MSSAAAASFKSLSLSRKTTLVRSSTGTMPSKAGPLPSNILTDEDGRIPFIIGFGSPANAATWGTADARYDFGHDVFRTDPSTTYEKLFAFVSDLLQVRELKETMKVNGHANGTSGKKSSQVHSLKELVVAWGPEYGRDLSRTTMTESNITSVLLLMARRGVDVIGGVCGPVPKERVHRS